MKLASRFRAYLPLVVLAVTVVAFFSPHLFPPRLYVAGDFGGSDFTDLFWPLKSLLGRSLKVKELPLWSNQIGAGFPILGEGEIQLFSPTSLFFAFLPLPLAFQLTVVTAFLLNGLGVYFLGRQLNFSQISSLFASLAFMLAAPFILGLEHLTIITTASFLPWAWLVVFRWTAKLGQKQFGFFPEGFWLAIILAVQFLQASPQITLLTFLSSGFLFLVMVWPQAKRRRPLLDLNQLKPLLRPLAYLGFAFLLSVILGSVQIFPSWEMRQHSNRAKPFRLDEMGRFSLNGQRLVNFIIPFALSNPSYPPAYFQFGKGPLLWETNGYVGLSTFFLALAGLFICRRRTAKALRWLLLISLLLAFGPNTPFGRILGVFPLSAFRVPGRFLIPVDLSLVLLAAAFLDQKLLPIIKRTASQPWRFSVGPALIIILILDLFSYGFRYNTSVPAAKILADPFTAQVIKRETDRYLSLAGWYVYNVIYLQEGGWRGRGEAYLPFQSTLFPNINLLYRLPGVSSYAGMKVKRADDLDAILQGYFQINVDNRTAWVSPQALEAILTMAATRYLITPVYLNLPYPPVAEIAEPYPHLSLAVYRLPFAKPRAWFTNQVQTIKSEQQLQQILTTGVFVLPDKAKSTTFVEKPLTEIFSSQDRTGADDCPKSKSASDSTQTSQPVPMVVPAKLVKDTNRELVLRIKAPSCGLIVLADTFYPGWEARLNGQPVPILRANYNFRAVPVPAGEQLITFSYRPRSLYYGTIVSAGGLMLLAGLLGKWQFARFQKRRLTTDHPKEQGLL